MRNKRYIICILCSVFCILCAHAQSEVLTLDSCLSSARQRNCTIRTAQLEVLIAREVKKQMLWKYFPQVTIEGFAYGAARHLVEADVTQGMEGSTGDFLKEVFELLTLIGQQSDPNYHLSSEIKLMRWGVSAQARAVQPLFWGGQIVNANKLAKLGINAAELKQEVSERDVLQEVAETYWLVAGLQQKQVTVQKATELLDSVAHVAQTAYNHGLVTSNDVMRVQLMQNELRTKSVQLNNGIRLASRLLCHQIGQPTNEAPLMLETMPEDETIDQLAAEPESIDIDGRPEAKLLEMNVKYNRLMKKVTLGESLPHLGIGISGGYTNFFEKNRFNGIAFAHLSIPLTGWGETAHKLKQHNYRIQQAQMMLEHYREKLDLQNRQAYDQLTESVQLMEQHRSGRELAKENYRVALMNYQAGVGTMTELLESEALLLAAENAYTDARISYRIAQRKFNDYNK